jgi:hypothetical protein
MRKREVRAKKPVKTKKPRKIKNHAETGQPWVSQTGLASRVKITC